MHRIAQRHAARGGEDVAHGERPVVAPQERQRDDNDDADQPGEHGKAEVLAEVQLLAERDDADVLEAIQQRPQCQHAITGTTRGSLK